MRVPKSAIVSRITALRVNIDALKAANQSMGGDSCQNYLTYSGNPNDYAVAVAALRYAKCIVTFTNAHATHGALIFPAFRFSVDNPTVDGNQVYGWTAGNTIQLSYQRQSITPTATSWVLQFTNVSSSTAHNVYLSCLFSGTDTGTFTITPA